MKNAPWLFLPPEAWPATTVATRTGQEGRPAGGEALAWEAVLDEAEGRHAFGALRLREGDAVVLFDGHGRTAPARLARREGQSVCRVAETGEIEAAARPRLTVAVAVPKGRRAAWLVEKCTETGADAFQPLIFSRSVAGLGEDAPAASRWRAWALAACKQCRRARLPKILRPRTLEEWLSARAAKAAKAEKAVILYGAPGGRPFADWSERAARAGEVVAVIGPEGGLADDEIKRLEEAGAAGACWGMHVLRIETAAVAACVAVRIIGNG